MPRRDELFVIVRRNCDLEKLFGQKFKVQRCLVTAQRAGLLRRRRARGRDPEYIPSSGLIAVKESPTLPAAVLCVRALRRQQQFNE